MADINQFLRSKERLVELLHELKRKTFLDAYAIDDIKTLENSIGVLDEKIDACLSGDESAFNLNFG